MPAIIQDEKQQGALKSIEEELAIIEMINSSLGDGVGLSIVATPASGKTFKVDVCDKDIEKVQSVLLGYKKRLSKDIQGKAKTFRIALSEKEMAILDI